MDIEIITIGDELLIGQVIDTNSAWMGKELEKEGFCIRRKMSVGDVENDIRQAIDEAMQRVGAVLLTGGIGPTRDDITRDTLCRYFGCGVVFSEKVYAHIVQMAGRSGREVNELTRLQAMVPDGCRVIMNHAGTAPCTWFEREGKILVSMPGVPHEMRWLMHNEVIPRLKQAFGRDVYVHHHTLRVWGYSESALAMKLEEFEAGLPRWVKLAYLPERGMVRLRLSARGGSDEATGRMIISQKEKLHGLLGNHILSEEDKAPEVLVGEALAARNWRVGTAESCTGGSLAALITSVPGSSRYFAGGVVSYANEVKRRVLGVSGEALEQHGAVSREVVEQMALGAVRILDCDWAVATSGVAGPDGGSPEKPVGTVWIAVASRRGVAASRRFGSGSALREVNISRASDAALLMLLEFVELDNHAGNG